MHITKEVMELFKLLQLHNVFTIYPTLEECLEAFKEAVLYSLYSDSKYNYRNYHGQ